MTIRDFLLKVHIAAKEDRLKKLSEMDGTPKIILTLEAEALADLKAGKFKVSGDKDALDDEMINSVPKKGRGGKGYLSMNDGTINYFPEAAYGHYIKRVPKEGVAPV